MSYRDANPESDTENTYKTKESKGRDKDLKIVLQLCGIHREASVYILVYIDIKGVFCCCFFFNQTSLGRCYTHTHSLGFGFGLLRQRLAV